MAQADIGERQHRHQTDEALGRMSAEVLAAALDRHSGGPHADVCTQFVRDGDGFDDRHLRAGRHVPAARRLAGSG